MQQEPRPYRYKLSLRLGHPSGDLSVCSRHFGLTPIRLWQQGKPRQTPKGDPLPGVWRDSYWVAALDVLDTEEFEDALSRIAVWLTDSARFLAEHRQSGGDVALFIGFFLERPNSGFTLSPAILGQYSQLGVELAFDIYGPEDKLQAL